MNDLSILSGARSAESKDLLFEAVPEKRTISAQFRKGIASAMP
ncbi:MAG TPA: hypothetical protein VKX41_02115 [Alloacidobacterium sp.]|jgi:hypothetical protein|nr:hypothetical protein [Alloacidobacterium sp.]